MATLVAEKWRLFDSDVPSRINDLPVIASDIIYKGSLVGDNASGYARPLVAGDPLLGIAEETVDNSAGGAGAKTVKVRQQWAMQVSVTGVTGVGNVGATVYASDDDTFTLTSTSNTAIGKIIRFVGSTTVCVVYCEAAALRSI